MPRTKKFNPDHVLDQATEVFAKHGYYGVSMSLLVERLRVNRASLYGTFGDKQRLYRECLNRYVQIWPVPHQNGSENGVLDMLEAIRKRYYAHPEARGCFLLKSGSEVGADFPEISEFVSEYYLGVEKSFKGYLEKQGKEPATAKFLSAKDGARYLVNQCYGMHVQAQMSPDLKRSREIINQALALLS
ncbi:MAG: TetR family transcriptional regulator [Bacteroidetes bacterium]|nr:TetR family transcriptional regulator [Bacteroidota bacterium]